MQTYEYTNVLSISRVPSHSISLCLRHRALSPLTPLSTLSHTLSLSPSLLTLSPSLLPPLSLSTALPAGGRCQVTSDLDATAARKQGNPHQPLRKLKTFR